MLGLVRSCLVVILVAAGLGAPTAPAAAVDTVTVSGRVLGHDGLPVEGATIELVLDPDTDDCPELDADDFPVLATTDANGRFSFTCTADFPWVAAKLPSGEFAGWRTFLPGVYDDVVFRAYATRGSISGTVYDEHGAPAPGAEMMFVWDQPGAGAYDYFDTDAQGRYRVDGLYPGVEYTIYVWLGDWQKDYSFTATEGALTHDFEAGRPADEPPGGAVTASSGRNHRLKVSGWAHDDYAVAKVMVAIRSRSTGKWLRANGSWGAYQTRSVKVTAPLATRSGWWFKKWLRPGRYGVSVVVVDGAGHRNPAPRPWRTVRVRR